MNPRRTRFALEVLFLVGLAAGLALAKLTALEIVGGMAVGWAVVALLEWAAWRGEPHFGSGLPPRYYVPRTSLPPAQPLEQVFAGYPDPQRDEAPTWIASASLREEVLGEWPLVSPVHEPESDPVGVDSEIVVVEQTFEEAAVPLPPATAEQSEADAKPVALPVAVVAPGRPYGTARHELEPFAAPPRRRLLRRSVVETFAIEVPARIAPTELPRLLDRE